MSKIPKIDRSKKFRGMSKTELMMLLAIQKGRQIIAEGLIDAKQHLEPMSVQRRRELRYQSKAEILEDYEKLKKGDKE